MKQFRDYILEKIDRLEFEWALSPNANIQGGAEFEFIFSKHTENNENIFEEYHDLMESLQNNIEKYNEFIWDYDDLLKDEQNLEDEIYDLKQKNEEVYEKQIELKKFQEKMEEYLTTSPLDEVYYENMLDFIKNNDFEKYDDGLWDDIIGSKEEVDLSVDLFLEENLDDNDWFVESDIIYDLLVDNIETPFKDEDYNYEEKSTTAWNIEKDPSLSEGGIEITSPVKQVHELLNDIEDMFFWIDDVGSTDSTCGFHVHMSTIKKGELDPIKLLMFVEEDSILKHFESRRNNSYTKSIDLLKKDYFTEEDLMKVIQKKDVLKDLKNTEKYMGVHIIDLKDNHVEFRYMGSGSYHKNFKAVRENIAKYAHWLEIATNPKYKRKEYLKKINVVMNKIKFSFLEQLFWYLESKYDDNWFKKHKKALKPYKDTLKVLKKTYKKSMKSTHKTININNKVFTTIEDFIDELIKGK